VFIYLIYIRDVSIHVDRVKLNGMASGLEKPLIAKEYKAIKG
jgi:hypothetical protein